MPRKRKTSVLSRAVAEAVAKRREDIVASTIPQWALEQPTNEPKTPADRLYNLIFDKCRERYRFCERDDCALPIIRREDVEESEDGIFIVRFRCNIERMHPMTEFEKVAKDVCRETQSGFHFFHAEREERYAGVKLPYEECVWVIQKGEIDENCMKGEEEVCEAEIERRFKEAEENFA